MSAYFPKIDTTELSMDTVIALYKTLSERYEIENKLLAYMESKLSKDAVECLNANRHAVMEEHRKVRSYLYSCGWVDSFGTLLTKEDRERSMVKV